jgi:hypothetical protein
VLEAALSAFLPLGVRISGGARLQSMNPPLTSIDLSHRPSSEPADDDDDSDEESELEVLRCEHAVEVAEAKLVNACFSASPTAVERHRAALDRAIEAYEMALDRRE